MLCTMEQYWAGRAALRVDDQSAAVLVNGGHRRCWARQATLGHGDAREATKVLHGLLYIAACNTWEWEEVTKGVAKVCAAPCVSSRELSATCAKAPVLVLPAQRLPEQRAATAWDGDLDAHIGSRVTRRVVVHRSVGEGGGWSKWRCSWDAVCPAYWWMAMMSVEEARKPLAAAMATQAIATATASATVTCTTKCECAGDGEETVKHMGMCNDSIYLEQPCLVGSNCIGLFVVRVCLYCCVGCLCNSGMLQGRA